MHPSSNLNAETLWFQGTSKGEYAPALDRVWKQWEPLISEHLRCCVWVFRCTRNLLLQEYKVLWILLKHIIINIVTSTLCGVKPLNPECDIMQCERCFFEKWELVSVTSNAHRVDVKWTKPDFYTRGPEAAYVANQKDMWLKKKVETNFLKAVGITD